jgi:hypothetical protein
VSYYNDARDVLEAAYPACTSFLRYHAQPTVAGLRRRACGIVMVLSPDLPSALERFKLVCYGLEDSMPWNRFHFDVYDFRGIDEVLPLLSAHGPIRGAGELFWIDHGAIADAMIEKFEWACFDEFTKKLLGAQSRT